MRKRNLPTPTPHFFSLLFVLGAIWYAASSQNNSAVYLLFFALLSVFLVSLPHALLNLGGLKTTAEAIKPAFAGQEVSVPLEIANASRAVRRGISVELPGLEEAREMIHRIEPGQAERIALRFTAPVRGQYELETFCLTSVYPLGFFRARQCATAKQSYIVYPKPAGDLNLPAEQSVSSQHRTQPEPGEGDDFAGVRSYVPGESQRHIDWKAVARGQALMTKQFATESAGALYLDFSRVRFANLEEKLSQLTLWVIEAERARKPYGLRLPETVISPSVGDSHFHRCLRALAFFR